MAHMDTYFDADFDLTFDVDSYAKESLTEAGKILEAKMKDTARQTIHHDGDSEMIKSIKASKPKQANGAYIINVGPRGYSKIKIYYAKNGKGIKTGRKHSVSNALKAIWKEYGIPNRQPAQPFISTASTQVENQVLDLLQKKYEDKTK